MYEIPERYKAKFKSGTVLNRACEAYGDYLKEEANNKDDEYEEGAEGHGARERLLTIHLMELLRKDGKYATKLG